jgi:hypothetical protein
MIDKREDILARLYAILLESHSGDAGAVVRNRGELPNNMRPAKYLMDGDEETDPRSENRGRPDRSPMLVNMKPVIYAAIEQRKPANEGAGEAVNEIRRDIIRAVLFDEQLKTIVGSNGSVAYAGCITDLERGRTMNGEIGLQFNIRYVLNPADL